MNAETEMIGVPPETDEVPAPPAPPEGEPEPSVPPTPPPPESATATEGVPVPGPGRAYFRVAPALATGGVKQIGGLFSRVEVVVPGVPSDDGPAVDFVVDVSAAVRGATVRLAVGDAAVLGLEVLAFELDPTPRGEVSREDAEARYRRHVESEIRATERRLEWLRAEARGDVEELVPVGGIGRETGADEYVSPTAIDEAVGAAIEAVHGHRVEVDDVEVPE